MEYFGLYLLTQVVGIGGGYAVAAGLGAFITGIIYLICLDMYLESSTKASIRKLGKTFIIASIFFTVLHVISPTKEEAIFITVGGMALQNDVDERVISLLSKTMDLSEEAVLKLTRDLTAEDAALMAAKAATDAIEGDK